MPLKLTPNIVRLALLALVALLSTAAISFAASGGGTTATPAAAPVPAAQQLIRVPDVRGKAFVFAKGMLEDSGFAWRVAGATGGYPANVVVAQSPTAGTRVVDNGMPTVRVTLSRNTGYAEQGVPENVSPYAGSKVVLPRTKPVPVVRPTPVAKPTTKPVAKPKPTTKPVAKPTTKPVTKPVTKPTKPKPTTKPVTKPAARPPAFVVPGAPKEPLDELTLTARAKQLDAWLARHPQKSDANVRHWFYQHEWIVTGAKFGWSNGDDALRTLVRTDDKVIDLWGIGSRSRAVAARALREVEAKTG
ncbi:MAG: PASTA domain-containing protein [Gaiellaceae bacterium]